MTKVEIPQKQTLTHRRWPFMSATLFNFRQEKSMISQLEPELDGSNPYKKF